MIWIDVKYANMISAQLERYNVTQHNPFVANFRCPICGDSQKNKRKTRGYLYTAPGGQHLNFKCHNCGVGMKFKNLLKQIAPVDFKKYMFELYKEGDNKPSTVVESETKMEAPDFKQRLLDNLLDRVSTLPDDNVAVKYCNERMIPTESRSRIYFIDDLRKVGQLSPKYKEKLDELKEAIPQIVFPYFLRDGRLIGLMCRAIGVSDDRHRYTMIKINEQYPFIFGLDELDTKEPSFCLEGQFDSLFLPNSIAVGTIDYKRVTQNVPTRNMTFVFDNQPRNREVLRAMRGACEKGLKVCVWPSSIKSKDVNEMVTDEGFSPDEILEVINKNTFSGLSLRLKIEQWRKLADDATCEVN